MNTIDPTEEIRRRMVAEINANAQARQELEKEHGQVWSTDEIRRDFEVVGFAAPLIVVRRLADGKKGSLFFQHSPRFYWGFQSHTP